MDNDDKLFDFMTIMYNEMQNGFKKVDDRFNIIETEIGVMKSDISNMKSEIVEIKSDISSMKSDLKETKERVIHIEEEHGKKLTALFDGYKQNSDKLYRIEMEVSRHDEFIMRRVK